MRRAPAAGTAAPPDRLKKRGGANAARYQAILGRNVHVARKARKLTQAAFTGVQRNAVAQLEDGKVDVRLSTLVALAEMLGVPPFVLLLGEDEFRELASLVGEHDRVRQVATADPLARGVPHLTDRARIALLARAARDHPVVQRELEQERDLAKAQAGPLFQDAVLVEQRSLGATVGAAIGSQWLPGIGGAIGALLALYAPDVAVPPEGAGTVVNPHA